MIHFYLNSYTTPARSFAQKLLHRICYTGVQLTSRWSNCIWTPAKSNFSSSSISLWRQGQPGGGLRTVTLCGVSDTQTCGEMRLLFVLGQPSVEIARVGWANMWCGERLRPQQPSAEIVRLRRPNMWWNVNFFWALWGNLENLYNVTLGTLRTFTWKPWALWGNLEGTFTI